MKENGASQALDVLRNAGMKITADGDRYRQGVGGFSVEKDGHQVAVFRIDQGQQALERAISIQGCVVVLIDPRKQPR